MTTTNPRIFGQAKPVQLIPVTLCTIPLAAGAQISLFVCNQDSTVDQFSIELIPSGDSPDPSRYIAYLTPILGNAVFAVAGVSMSSGDSIVVVSTNGNCSFTATGFELIN
jgi:hypothetical protein